MRTLKSSDKVKRLAFHRQFDDFLIINSIFKYENKILGKIENN
jgi:hypothetical protein